MCIERSSQSSSSFFLMEMRSIHNHFFFTSILAFLVLRSSSSAAATPSFPINVWPKPTTFLWPSPQAATLLSPTFAITTPSDRHLSAAAARYLRLIRAEKHRPLVVPKLNISKSSPPLVLLSVAVAELQAPLSHAVDESYTLRIPAASGVANITAVTPWGAMRGMETFSQLVWGCPSRVAVGVEISDSPIFPHRGLMLDTSRNFYAVEDILRTIEAMSQNKMNVFHWHITDSHSFPLVLPSEPDLAERGSYGSEMVYSPQDVQRIVQFGFEHGVRVLPEIDAPGHTGSWAAAYPEIVACANMFWWPAGSSWDDRLASEPGTGHLNPLLPQTYKVVKNVMSDVADMFPETFYHAGADEVIPGCWKADPIIQAFLSSGGTLSELLETFVNKTHSHLLSLNKTVVYWEDVLLDSTISVNLSLLPHQNTILQTWNNGPDNTKRIVSAGYRAIVSSSSFYYLDCGHGEFLGNDSQYNQPPGADQKDGGSWCGPFKTWSLIYNYDITDGVTDEEAKLVLGGEVALWSEQADPSVLDQRLWPRTCAFAEAMWSGNRDETGAKRFAEATNRLNEWRYRMVSRGIRAEPIQPLWCIRNPGMCNTVNAL